VYEVHEFKEIRKAKLCPRRCKKWLRNLEPQFGNEVAIKYIHPAKCDACDAQIIGMRYKCNECPDYDLCESCIVGKDNIHPGNDQEIFKFYLIVAIGHTFNEMARTCPWGRLRERCNRRRRNCCNNNNNNNNSEETKEQETDAIPIPITTEEKKVEVVDALKIRPLVAEQPGNIMT
jgi:hypothetical protein